MSNHIYISKIDASKRQLEIAIRLFFRYGDVVAIHTLSGASHNILNDLAKKQNKESAINNWIKNNIKKEKQKEIYGVFHNAKNFFKHANWEDQDKTIKFDPVLSEYLIYDCCELYQSITQENLPLIKLFKIWFYCKNSDLILDKKMKEIFKFMGSTVSYENREAYLNTLPVFEKDSI